MLVLLVMRMTVPSANHQKPIAVVRLPISEVMEGKLVPTPSLDLLRTFLAVHRAGSVTAAAQLLGLSQPAVTGQLKALEQALGRSLFLRHARGVTATAAGEELAQRLAGPMDELNRAIGSDLFADNPTVNSVVHIGAPAELAAALLMPSLADQPAAGVSLRFTIGLTDELLAQLATGALDIVLATQRPRRRGIAAEPLWDEEFVLVAAPFWADRLPADELATTGAKALLTAPLLAYSEDMPIVRRYWRHVFGVPPTGRAAIVVPDLRGVLAAAVAGAGVTVLPRYLCAGQLAAGALRQLLDPPDPPINTFYLATRAGTLTQPHLARVHQTLLTKAKLW
jgi:DNA-binding transcriptional LysR family regulator